MIISYNLLFSPSALCNFSLREAFWASLSLNKPLSLSISLLNYWFYWVSELSFYSAPFYKLPRLLYLDSSDEYLFFQSARSLSLYCNWLLKSEILLSYYDFIWLNCVYKVLNLFFQSSHSSDLFLNSFFNLSISAFLSFKSLFNLSISWTIRLNLFS